jgi:hypothetical protein
MGQFREAYARQVAAGGVERVVLATENCILLKLLAAEVRAVPVQQGGVNTLASFVGHGFALMDESPWLSLHADWRRTFRDMRRDYLDLSGKDRLPILDPDTGKPFHLLLAPPAESGAPAPRNVLVVAGGGSLSLLNRTRYPESGPPVVCERLSELRNFAVFTDATGARQYALGRGEPQEISAYQLERDACFGKRTAAAVGPAMVLNVLNPTPRVRVLVEETGTYLCDPRGRFASPVHVVGDRRVSLGAAGVGSARLVSPPLSTQAVGSGHYLVVEFGAGLRQNPNRLGSVERLWGTELMRDRRWLIGHARNISVLSEEEYAAFRPPEAVREFPAGLTHPQLEYTGFFETGWVGAESRMRLTQGEPGRDCVVRGMVPGLPGGEGFRTELTVLIDGAPAARRLLGPGEFEVRVAGGPAAGPRWVELRFSQVQTLPEPDGRPAAALVRFIGFEPRQEPPSARPPEKLSSFPADLAHPALEQYGISADGWGAGNFRARLTQAAPGGEVVVRGQVPEVGGNAGFRTEVVLLLDGREVARRALGPGDFELRAAAGKTAQARWVECRFTSMQALPPPDGRGVGAHVRFLGFEPARQGP